MKKHHSLSHFKHWLKVPKLDWEWKLILTVLHKSAIVFRVKTVIYTNLLRYFIPSARKTVLQKTSYSRGLQNPRDIDEIIRLQTLSLPSKRLTLPETVFVFPSQCYQSVCGHCSWWFAWKAAEVPGGANNCHNLGMKNSGLRKQLVNRRKWNDTKYTKCHQVCIWEFSKLTSTSECNGDTCGPNLCFAFVCKD